MLSDSTARLMRLLRTLILRPLRRDFLRTVLTMAAVALGVAVVVAIDLAGDAATGSFRASMTTLAGKTDLEIRANGGIDETWVGRLASLAYEVSFSPVMEGRVSLPGTGTVSLFGFDFSGAPEDTAMVSESLAKRLGVRTGSALALPIGRYTVNRILDAGPSDFVAIDVAAMQKAFGRYGKLDRIDVTVASTENFSEVERAISSLLPPGYLVTKPGLRNEENQRMLRAFQWNLRVLSYISLIVGAFLIYNTISISVVRRRAEIGVLRALGAGRGAVLSLFLAEAVLIGLAGAALGVGLGRALAGSAVGLISSTVNALYTTSRPTPVELPAAEIWIGILAGILTALVSAFAPAREAMHVAPTEAMSRGAREHHTRMHWRRYLAWAAVFVVLAAAASQVKPLDGRPVGGYASALLAVAAAALATPAIVLGLNRLTRFATPRSADSLLAGRSLTGSLARTSVIVAALSTAIAMMASVAIMVGSFRETVALWLDTQLRADLYLSPANQGTPSADRAFPPRFADTLAGIPGVAAVNTYHPIEFHYHGERATLAGTSVEIDRLFGHLRFLPGEDRDAILRSLPGNDRAIISEPFGNKYGIGVGDQIDLPLGPRKVRITVAGIYYDYSSSQGIVLLDCSTLFHYLPAQPATAAAVYLKPGVNTDNVRHAIEHLTSAMNLDIAPNRVLRNNAMVVFDRTFAITWALEAVAIAVAMLGAANSLLALVLDRRRELGMLRYLGASAGQVRNMILVEAGLLGLLAATIGLALGFALSLLLIFVVNKQSFGWTIQFHPPAGLLAGALVAVWCVTVAAGLYPARVAARLNPIDVMHEE